MANLSIFFISSLILTLLICSQSTNLPPFPSVSDLPYQAHSFNEVGYLRQLLRRGVKYFKIDISLANRQSCSINSDWNQTQKCYRTGQYAEEYCCLALRGDTSARDSFDYEFSTLDNFIDMVENHAATFGFNKLILFAINWQFGFQFSNVLVENSIYRLAKLMQKYPLINFGFGTDDFIFEYDRICRNAITQSEKSSQKQPLQTLNQESCNQKRKLISKSKFFLQSGSDDPSDPRDYYGRYRNFNTYYKDIISRCNNGFPSWVKKNPDFPLIFWEPSDEQQIQLVIETFLSEKCRIHHGRDIKGLAITSNIDPEVFEFYLKKVNLTVKTNPMVFYPNKEKIALDDKRNLLAKMQVNGSSFMILGQQNDATSQGVSLELIMLGNDYTTQIVQEVRRVRLNPSNGTVRIVGGKGNMMVVQKPMENVEDGTMNLTLFNEKLQQVSDPQELDRYVEISAYDGFYYILRRTVNPTVFNIIKTADFSKASIVASFSLVIEKARNVESLLVMQDGSGQLKYFLSGSVNKQVWVGEVKTNNLYKSAFIAYGTNSKLFLKENGMIAITTENGSCNSGYEVNNGDAPLCGIFKYGDFKEMTSTQTTISLIQTTVGGLMEFMMREAGEPVTPCTQKFVHSKVFNGRNVNTVDIWGRLFFVSEYVHISEQGMLNTLFCGASNYERLPGNKKGLLGSIWSRGNVGKAEIEARQE